MFPPHSFYKLVKLMMAMDAVQLSREADDAPTRLTFRVAPAALESTLYINDSGMRIEAPLELPQIKRGGVLAVEAPERNPVPPLKVA